MQSENIEIDINEGILVDILANDVDPDGDSLFLTAITQPSNGIISLEGNKVHYTPNLDYIGTDKFSYSFKEKDLVSGLIGINEYTSNVFINIVEPPPPNLAPIATNDSALLQINETINIQVLLIDSTCNG